MPRYIPNPFLGGILCPVEENVGPLGDIEFLIGDSGGNVGPDSGSAISILGNPDIDVVGTSGTNSFQLTNLTKVTPYIVDSVAGAAPYQTIQAAVTAVGTAAVDALIYVRPGTYTEDITFVNQNITLQGDPGLNVIVVGTHVPSATHNLTLDSLQLQDATAILSSAVAGASAISIQNSLITVTNGYVFNLANWSGELLLDNCGEASTNDGVVSNSGGAAIKFINSEMGSGSGNTMSVTGNGNVRFDTCNVNCPVNIAGTGTFIFQNGCGFKNTVTIGGTKSGSCVNSAFLTTSNQALVYNSANTGYFSNVTFNSSNNPCIGGTGTIELSGVSFLSDSNLNSGLTVSYASVLETGTLYSQATSLDREENHKKFLVEGSTSDAAVLNIYTKNLGSSSAVYRITASVVGHDAATPLSVGYQVDGVFATTGIVASEIGVEDRDEDEGAGASDADSSWTVSGNSAILQCTGVAGKEMNWRAIIEYVKVE